MHVYLKNIPAKYDLDPILNGRAFWRGYITKKNEEQQQQVQDE